MTQQRTSTQLGSRKKLRLFDVVAQSVGFMGPVFSIAFLVPLVMGITSASGKGAGAAAPLAVLIAAVGALGFGWIVAQYAKRVHAAGALYDYVTLGLGARIGGAAGFLYYTSVIVLGCATLVILGGTIHDTLLAEFQHSLLPEIGWDLVLLAIVAVTVLSGVAVSTRAQLVLALVSIVVVGMFFVYVAIKSGVNHDVTKTFTPSGSPEGVPGVLFGVLYGVILFVGVESAANLGEETENPAKNIPRAVLFSILAITGFYVLSSYAQVAGFHFSVDEFGEAAGAPLFALAAPASAGGLGSVWLVRLMELVVILDILAVLIGCATASSRGLFALARDGRLPRPITKVSRRSVPIGAVLVVLAFLLTTILVNEFATSLWAIPGQPHYVAMFSVLSTFGSFAFVFVYFLLSAGALRGLSGHEKPAVVIAASVVGMVVMGAAVFGSVYKVPSLSIYTELVGVAIFLIGLLVSGRSAAAAHAPAVTGPQPAAAAQSLAAPSAADGRDR